MTNLLIIYLQKLIAIQKGVSEVVSGTGGIMDIDEAIQKAQEHHQAGNLEQAEFFYGEALKIQPDHVDVLHSLGVIYHQLKKCDSAIECLNKAILLNPDKADLYNDMGNALKDKGQLDDAISYYRKALQLNPNFYDTYTNLESALQEKKSQLFKRIDFGWW